MRTFNVFLIHRKIVKLSVVGLTRRCAETYLANFIAWYCLIDCILSNMVVD